jgi:signal transduction histidine kinase
MADSRGVEIQIADDMPMLIVDVGRLELALVNLISNAVKYCDPDKPRRLVEITARRLENGACEICIRDNGIGIPAARISRIFRRFTRAHSDRPDFESVTGVGLGLAIVDDCVNAMDGSITVESIEGTGTVFCVTFPPAARSLAPAPGAIGAPTA